MEEIASLVGGKGGFRNGHYRKLLSKNQIAGHRTRENLPPVFFGTGLYFKSSSVSAGNSQL